MKNKFFKLSMLIVFSIVVFGCKKDSQNLQVLENGEVKSATAKNDISLKSEIRVIDKSLDQSVYGETVPVYRLQNPWTGKHMLAMYEEATILRNTMHSGGLSEWVIEGVAFNLYSSQTAGTVPLYRYYSDTGDHYFSNSSTPPPYFVSEGIVGYMYNSRVLLSKPLYSYFKKRGTFDRIYTTNFDELGNGNKDWQLEGIIGYVI